MYNLDDILAFARGLYSLYRSLHWNADSYSSHLLFEKLYTKMEDEMDDIAEKLVGTQSRINEQEQMCKIVGFQITDPVESENIFLDMIDNYLDNEASTGIDNLLGDIYSSHEKNLYLLKMIDY